MFAGKNFSPAISPAAFIKLNQCYPSARIPKSDDKRPAAGVTPLHEGKRETAKDALYQDEKPPHDFNFGAGTVNVFDDMVQRSVPFYEEIQRMACELAADFALPGTRLYDVGCSTGTTLQCLHPLIDTSVEFVGIDNSDAMLDKANVRVAVVHVTDSSIYNEVADSIDVE